MARRSTPCAPVRTPNPLPMDVQADMVDLPVAPQPRARRPHDRPAGDPAALQQAAKLLASATRPVILAGGGVILSEGWKELRQLAEHLGACVVTTMQGKGAFPEDHPLTPGTWAATATCGNFMTTHADVLLAVCASLTRPPVRAGHIPASADQADPR